MIQKILSNIISWLSKNFKVLAVFIIGIFAAFVVLQHNQLKDKNKEIDRLNNNILYYQEQQDTLQNDNRVLRLTVDEFKDSKDSIVQQLNNVRKELNIKDKQLEQAQSQTQQIIVDTAIVVKENNFKEVIKPNELTSIIIAKTDSILTAKIDIKNTQTLFLSSKKVYKRQYKNWFRRLLKFDFKKERVYRYTIKNSNELIKVTDTKLITLE